MNVEHHLGATYAWHGRLMVLAWTVLLPLGIFVARYYKVTRAQRWPQRLDNKQWWYSHLVLQVSGVACMSAGLAVLWARTGSAGFGGSLHATLGWLVVLLGWMQLIGGYLRGSKGGPGSPGDHYDMTRRRVLFEWLHKAGGYGALLLSILVTGLGLRRAEAPLWMWLTITLWWVVVLVGARNLQQAGRCIDTYQAIWGPDRRHPGNTRAAIGWGIRRYTTDKDQM
jgi:hypothetical protein